MPRPHGYLKSQVDGKKIVNLKDNYKLTFAQIAKRFEEVNPSQIRDIYYKEKCQSGQTHT